MAEFAVLKPKAEGSQIRRKCFYVMIVVLGVLPQIFAGKPSGGPSFVKGMAKEIVFGDSGVQFLEKLSGGHTVLGRLGACQPTIRAISTDQQVMRDTASSASC
jgi:hypothetical protein